MKLSIIIPCYNCANTLREAVDSCYEQDMTETDFEIIMVEDGSTDGTRVLLEEIVREHKNIRLIFHPENRGGGAARNTGIKEAQGEIIYCLDSDNFFAPHSVKPMLSYLDETKADGVVFYERRFFMGNNHGKYSPRYCKILDRDITLKDIFSEDNIMLDNFFYRKNAFLKTNQYPEHHGFDTQTFEVDFLAQNLKVRICPNSIFYHRQNQPGKKSYYEREYEKGLISINTYLSFEPSLDLFHDKFIEKIVTFDFFQNNYHGQNTNLLSAVMNYVKDGGELRHNPSNDHSASTKAVIEMARLTLSEDYESAYKYYVQCIKNYGMSPFLLYFSLRLAFGLSGTKSRKINDRVYEYSRDHKFLNIPKYKRLPYILTPLLKIYLILLKKKS